MSYTAADRTVLQRVDETTQLLAGGYQKQISDLTDQLAASKAAEQTDQDAIDTLQGQLTAAEQQVADLQAQLATVEDELAACEAEHNPPAASPIGLPATGLIYCGVKVDDSGNDPSAIEAELGFTDALHRSYFVPGQEAALVQRCKDDHAKNRLPWVSIHVPDTWANMAAGVRDAWLHSMVDPMKALGRPVWYTLHHEPSDDQGTGNTPATYVAMYQHAYPMTKGSNVALVPILQSWPFYSWLAKPDHGIASWYDPNACDILGLDAYNQWWSGAPDSAWKTPAQTLDVASQLNAAFPGKPIAYGEWGVRTDPRTPGKAAQWMGDLYALAPSKNIVGLCYYSSGLNSPNGPWTLDGERKAAFSKLAHAATSVPSLP